MLEYLIIVLIAIVVLAALYLFLGLVRDMAKERGHNPWPWWLLSLAWSPIPTIIIMWLFFPPLTDED